MLGTGKMGGKAVLR